MQGNMIFGVKKLNYGRFPVALRKLESIGAQGNIMAVSYPVDRGYLRVSVAVIGHP